jgi:hypothetical protein|tara:strand:- start:520 stop:711 length:192 start_codon:yes stop_codon:yes gene_type:complete
VDCPYFWYGVSCGDPHSGVNALGAKKSRNNRDDLSDRVRSYFQYNWHSGTTDFWDIEFAVGDV